MQYLLQDLVYGLAAAKRNLVLTIIIVLIVLVLVFLLFIRLCFPNSKVGQCLGFCLQYFLCSQCCYGQKSSEYEDIAPRTTKKASTKQTKSYKKLPDYVQDSSETEQGFVRDKVRNYKNERAGTKGR